MRSHDVIVVGAGIVGVACAWAFACEGLEVLLLDSRPPGNHTSAAGMGHVVVMDDSEAQMRLTTRGRALLSAFLAEVPAGLAAPIEYEATGTLWIAEDEASALAVRAKRDAYANEGVAAEVLDRSALRAAEPCLAHDLEAGLLVPDDFVVYAPTVVQALLTEARAKGVRFEAKEVVHVGPRSVLARDGQRFEADCVVVAAGESSLGLIEVADLENEQRAAFDALAMRRRKGQLIITERYPDFARHQLVELGYLASAHGHARASVAFNLQPRATGQVLLGSSREYDAADDGVDQDVLYRMVKRAERFVPRVTDLQVLRCWSGFRVATEDHLPYVGPLWQGSSLLLACGHEGLGITTALSTARLLRDHVLARPDTSFPIEPYLPTRHTVVLTRSSTSGDARGAD
mgnify:CR=1 FL=1